MTRARRGLVAVKLPGKGAKTPRGGLPTPEQMAEFQDRSVMHVETATRVQTYRRLPVIDRLLTANVITEDEYSCLAYYRDQAGLADRSPVRSCCDNSPRGGNGPGVAILSAQIETGRMERDMGALWRIARAIAVDDWTLERWCVEQHGGRERYNGKGDLIAIVPVLEKQHMKRARIDLRAAAHRITR